MHKFTALHREVLRLCVLDRDTEQIAYQLGLTINQVKYLRQQNNKFLGGSNIESTAAGAARKKLINKSKAWRKPTIVPFAYKVLEELAKGTGVSHIHNRLSMENKKELEELMNKLFQQFNVKTRAQLVVAAVYGGYIK